MRIGIIGGGASGLYAACFLKRGHPSYEVVVFDKEKKLGRKIYATGNGHCNCYNARLDPNCYNNPGFIKGIYKDDFKYSDSLFDAFGVKTIEDENGLVYPASFDSNSFVEKIIESLKHYGVKWNLETKVIDYKKSDSGYILLTDKGEYAFDRLIIACGGKSSPKLGSDGSMFSVLKNHGYEISELRPGLTPLKLKGDFRSLKGIRHKAKVWLTVDSKKVFEEKGEVLFKEDGISGIVIFNAESYLARNNLFGKADIHLDLLPGMDESSIESIVNNSGNSLIDIKSLFVDELASHLINKSKIEEKNIAKLIKDCSYKVLDSYSFADSQVTIGGVNLKQISSDFESLMEKGIYIIGEALDIDGKCGGYNLSFCYMSAFLAASSLN